MGAPVLFFNVSLETIHSSRSSARRTWSPTPPADRRSARSSTPATCCQKGFRESQMGFASAMAWMLLLAVALVTAVLFWSQKRWVHYEEDGPMSTTLRKPLEVDSRKHTGSLGLAHRRAADPRGRPLRHLGHRRLVQAQPGHHRQPEPVPDQPRPRQLQGAGRRHRGHLDRDLLPELPVLRAQALRRRHPHLLLADGLRLRQGPVRRAEPAVLGS